MKTPTKFVLPLDDDQVKVLEDINRNHTTSRVRIRAHAILLSTQRFSIDTIAGILGVKRDTVSIWIDKWEAFGVASLLDNPRPGAPPKLNESDLKIVSELVKQNPQSPKTILANITEHTGKTISFSTFRRIIKKT